MGIDLNTYFRKQTDVAPLVVFRMFFGVMMFLSVLRFWANGWIEKLYLEPEFHFTYYGFEWVRVPGAYTYLIFLLCAFSALGMFLFLSCFM